MASEKSVLSRPVIAAIIAAITAAFIAGTRVSVTAEAHAAIPVAASSVTPQADLASEIHDLRGQLGETIKTMSTLDRRLATLEGRFDERDRRR